MFPGRPAFRRSDRFHCQWGIVTVSMGGACAKPAGGELSALFEEADVRLYRAKVKGCNRAELS